MRKPLYLLFMAVLVTTVLLVASCGGDKATTTSPTTTAAGTTTPTTTTPTTTTPTTTTPTTTTPTTTTPTTTTPTTTTPTTTTPTTTTPTTTTPTTTSPTTTTEPDARDELPSTYQYTITFTSSDGASGTYEVWAKGDKFRLEMTVEDQGETTTMIIIISEGYDYWYMPDQNMAMRYPSDSSSSPAATFDAFSAFFTGYYTVYYTDEVILAEWQAACSADPSCQSVQIVGHENISGEACTIFELTYTDGSTVKVWIATDKGYVMKVEETISGSTTTIEFSDIDFNPTIDDSIFEIPAGVTIMDI